MKNGTTHTTQTETNFTIDKENQKAYIVYGSRKLSLELYKYVKIRMR